MWGDCPDARALPWGDVEAAFSGSEVARLRAAIEAELRRPEFLARVARAMALDGEVRHDAKGLFVLGPSAAGKSHLLRQGGVEEAAVEAPRGALTLDGAIVRQASASWAEAVDLAASRGFAGLTNLFADFFKAPMDQAKEQIVQEAVRAKANLIIPDTASNFAATVRTIDRLLGQGYSLQFVAIYADRSVCEARGLRREIQEGKKYSGTNWRASVQAIVSAQEYILSRGLLRETGGVRVLDCSGVPRRIDLAGVEARLSGARPPELGGPGEEARPGRLRAARCCCPRGLLGLLRAAAPRPAGLLAPHRAGRR